MNRFYIIGRCYHNSKEIIQIAISQEKMTYYRESTVTENNERFLLDEGNYQDLRNTKRDCSCVQCINEIYPVIHKLESD